LGLRPEKVKALLPIGAAAAIAAAFNTPLAAVLFALEEVVGDLHAPVLGSVVLASATSWAVLRLLLGNDPLFQVPQYQLVNPLEFMVYCGSRSSRGTRVSSFHESFFSVCASAFCDSRQNRMVPAARGRLDGWNHGLVLCLKCWVSATSHVGEALNGGCRQLMVLLLILKLLAVTTSYASGMLAAFFGPSLFFDSGAMLGESLAT